MKCDSDRAQHLLRLGTGIPDAEFRDDQEEAIIHIVENRGRLLLVQKTGWGKSNVYFIATKLLREAGTGPALLISPLLSLMRNQIAQAKRMGVRAETIHSGNEEEWKEIEHKIKKDEVDILLISPERLANEHFRTEVLAVIAANVSLLVIDEAHCISDWGHDFRPQYRLIDRIVQNLPENLRLLATTATANDRVMSDLEKVLGPNITTLRGDLNRPSLYLQTISLPQQSERLAWLASQLGNLTGNGIIYTLTIRDAKRVASWLQSQGHSVEWYASTRENREELENALLENKVKALVATTALGMGFDKPDLGFVIHYQMPGSVIAYYQQVGRAGRALDVAYGVLLSGEEEEDITNYFIDNAFPTRQEVQLVLNALEEEPDGLSKPELLSQVNISKNRLDKTIDLLSLESPSPIAKLGTKWQLTITELSEEFWTRAEQLTKLRHDEQQQMQEYIDLSSGHMEFLIRALDGDPSSVISPNLPPLPTTPDPALILEATAFLRRTSLPIEPRKQWPTGGLPQLKQSGRIKPEYQAEQGRALCIWRDSGWGNLVYQGKYRDKHFDDELVEACANMVDEWNPTPSPTWVTCIPSRRHPDLVPSFAQRLAASLRIPFYDILEKTDDRPEQKSMANSSQQARNVDGSLALKTGKVPDGPVLLVDDMVDSRWTITVATFLLLSNGSGEVFPLALADTGHGE
jgi:ATP-dependent DNA helicase RecQ